MGMLPRIATCFRLACGTNSPYESLGANMSVIASRSPLHIPRRRFDPVAALVWLVLIPVSGIVGWYGFWRVLSAIWNFL